MIARCLYFARESTILYPLSTILYPLSSIIYYLLTWESQDFSTATWRTVSV